ncbi:MAG: hypothetical protein E7B11_07775 [Clostridiales bacterium]|nr:hypothetical protein [Clostridiales bacterium]MDU3240454.1 hypothetical protein [Clostridiales bacterium]
MYGLFEDNPKISTIYQFQNDSLIQRYRKHYYKNNKIARQQFYIAKQGGSDIINVKRNNNIVEGLFTSDKSEFGQTKSEILQQLQQFENIYTKIEVSK